EARALIGESDELSPSEPMPFVPRIARLPRERTIDRFDRDRPALPDRPPALPQAPVVEDEDEDLTPAASADSGRDSLTSLLEAVPSFRGDMV
ncbi:DUF3071 domain-containing protein, partial [Streptomyces sp. SID11233]|nr:DUF3071 domain-containing protein [Streptomyces sp. SID11233]